jgi:hypothetical protein
MRNLLLALVIASSAFAATTIELVITEDELQEAFEESIVDPSVDSIDLDIQTDMIVLSATRMRPATGIIDEASMDIYLDVVDGHLSVTIENAQWNSITLAANRIDVWNARIQRGIERITGNSIGNLQSVEVGMNQIVLTWEQ